MGKSNTGYVSNRVLKINVGFLLSGGPGHNHDTAFDVPRIKVSDDLTLEYLRGPIRLSRTTEGILVQGELHAGVEGECYRCLDPVTTDVTVSVEELYVNPPRPGTELSVGDDAILDLAPLLRSEVLISTMRGVLCREDCKGLCPTCGKNRNRETCDCEADDIDPRMAQLKNLLD